MAELTERERKIIRYMNIMANPNLQKVPFEVKDGLIRTIFMVGRIKFDEDEMTDLARAINEELNNITKDGLGFLDKHKDSFKGVSDFGL